MEKGKREGGGMMEETCTLVRVQNRLELFQAYDGIGAHLRLEDKHRRLCTLVNTRR